MPYRALVTASQRHPFMFSLVILLLIVIPGFIRTQQAINSANDAATRAQTAITQIQQDQVTACRNANRERAANKAPWQFLVLNASQNQQQTPEEKSLTRRFSIWLNKLYQPHDCHDLSRRYDIPPFPALK